MRQVEKKYRCIPFWSWNDKLNADKLVKQVEWMDENGVGGFFMHARGGLKTEYLGEEWFECIDACSKRAQELGMEAYAYDENGWPSGFVGGKLLEDMENRDRYLSTSEGEYDSNALASYDISGDDLVRVYGPVSCERSPNTRNKNNINPYIIPKITDIGVIILSSFIINNGMRIIGHTRHDPRLYTNADTFGSLFTRANSFTATADKVVIQIDNANII